MSRTPVRIFLSCFVSALIGIAATAAPASDASIETLLSLSRTQGYLEAVFASVDQSVKRGLTDATKDSTLTSEQQSVLNAVPGRVEALMRDALAWDTLRPEFLALYRATFDQEETDGLIAFYGSPTGRAFLRKMPAVQQNSALISQKHLQTLLPQVQALMQKALTDAKISPPITAAPAQAP